MTVTDYSNIYFEIKLQNPITCNYVLPNTDHNFFLKYKFPETLSGNSRSTPGTRSRNKAC